MATEEKQWQSRLLPVMIKMIVFLAIFFFLASLTQLIYMHRNIEQAPPKNKALIEELYKEKSAISLELLLIEKRYHQANTSLMSRIWLKYLGFVTGMILTFMGASFVLGKLRENQTDMQLSANEFKFSLVSSSPGIILAILGTLIMIITIYQHNTIDVVDSNIYYPTTEMKNEGTLPSIIENTYPTVKDSNLTRPNFEKE